MGYQIGPTDPIWSFEQQEIEKAVANFAKANGITTQAGWVTFVASITTLGQAIAVCKGLLGSVQTL